MNIFKDAGHQMSVEIITLAGLYLTKKCINKARNSRRARRIVRRARVARKYADGGIEKARAWKRGDVVELDPEPKTRTTDPTRTTHLNYPGQATPFKNPSSRSSAHFRTRHESAMNPYAAQYRPL